MQDLWQWQKLRQWLGWPRSKGALALALGGVAVAAAGVWLLSVRVSDEAAPPKAEAELCIKPAQAANREIEAEIISRAQAINAAIFSASLKRTVREAKAALRQRFPEISPVLLHIHLIYYACREIDKSPGLHPGTKARSLNTLVGLIIPEEIAARLGAENIASFSESLGTPAASAQLDGRWTGQDFFPGRSDKKSTRKPVPFQAELATDLDTVFGILSEPQTFGRVFSSKKRLLAVAKGLSTQEGLVFFQKTYTGMAGVAETVRYEGAWDRASGTITGKWWSPTDPRWWGRFVMMKTPRER